MALNNSYWFQDTGLYNSVATQSLRFDRGSNTYLTRTPSSASNRKTFTFSCWIKRANFASSVQTLIIARPTATPATSVQILDTNNIRIQDTGISMDLRSSRVFRDVSSWYHIVVAVDTTQSTSSNRAKLYINGSQETSFSTETYPTQDGDTLFNNTNQHEIGDMLYSGTTNFDGYMAEINFVDGSQLAPTSFGETKNGVWIPKAYTGSYGTNGYRLQFNQTGTGSASSSTIGADTSGNDNHFSSSGIVASDCDMPDSPENNFPTMNSNNADSATVLSEGNLKLSNSTAGTVGARNTMATPTSGKYYVEFVPTISGGNWPRAGIARISTSGNALDNETWFDMQNGTSNNRGTSGTTTSAFSTGDVGAIAFDADAGKIYLAKNNTWQNSGDPANGTGYMFDGLTDGPFLFSSHQFHSDNIMIWNFGQDSSFAGTETAQGNTDDNGIGDFYYSPPSGFLALCSANLPEPTISPNASTQADDYFNTVLYTGNGSTQSITGVGFQPDWVWAKDRGAVVHHTLTDSSRGVHYDLFSSSTSQQSNDTNGLTAFDSDGFSLGSSTNHNVSSNTYVAWNWKANGGTTSSNTDGSITSTVQTNTTAGFSIVLYTGTGSGATIGHGLGAVPQTFIVKSRDSAENWLVYHHKNTSAPETDALQLNVTNATVDSAGAWNDTAPTSTVFSVGSGNASNKSGDDFVAYCFAEIEGYSKFSSYTGNGSADGTFIYTGFRPAWFMIKRTDSAGSWEMYDEQRIGYNVDNNTLFADLANVESTADRVDILSNGFKLRSTAGDNNASGGTFIYMAFAEAPFKYSNAR